jgi:polynucleotide 5'-hydroxyl-kinase GRC3/NOL9
MEIISQPEWDGIVEELIKNKGTALLLGATDSGKSTLARYLIEKFLSKGIRISLVDSDIGQSTLGMPGTISIKTFKTQLDIKSFRYERMWFIGTLNPAKMLSLMIDVTKRVVNFAKKHSEIILIDTTGLVHGELGKALKIGKIKTIEPEHIIAVERHNELEHIIELIESINIHRVRASRMAKIRSREARIKYRKEKFNDYFNEPKIAEFLLDGVNFFYNGRPCYPKFNAFKKGTLIGLNHGEDTKALGILVELIKNSITFKSPIKSLKGINRVVFGDIVIE